VEYVSGDLGCDTCYFFHPGYYVRKGFRLKDEVVDEYIQSMRAVVKVYATCLKK
jgi:hypothetical protein